VARLYRGTGARPPSSTRTDRGRFTSISSNGLRTAKFAVTSTYKAQLAKAYLLADPKTAIDGSVTTEGGQTTFALRLPTAAPDPIASVVCLEVKP